MFLAQSVDLRSLNDSLNICVSFLQLISELSDIVTACLVDITDISTDRTIDGSNTRGGTLTPGVNSELILRQISGEASQSTSLFRDLESDLRKAVANGDRSAIERIVLYSDTLAQQEGQQDTSTTGAGTTTTKGKLGRSNITRVLWRAVVDAPQDLADLILQSTATPFDFTFVDDINGRTCLHEAAITGALRLVNMCLENGVSADKVDVYGRSAMHYAAMNGRSEVCRRLLEVADGEAEGESGMRERLSRARDREDYEPIVYATLKGSVDCVRVLLDEGGVPAHPIKEKDIREKEQASEDDNKKQTDLIPLSLAALAGHMDVVLLLLDYGAKSVPNSNGEYPIHFAARKGHADICRLLAQPIRSGSGGEEELRHEGWDKADKFNEWTPLFHAARWGHGECVRVLLEAGARRDALDDLGCLPVHWAAWYGHMGCAELLLPSPGTTSETGPEGQMEGLQPSQTGLGGVSTGLAGDVRSPSERSTGSSGLRALDSDIDLIPSLSLPPPMMPHRVYGHNYLDKQCLVQITIGNAAPPPSSSSKTNNVHSPVRLHPRLLGGSSSSSSTSLNMMDTTTLTPLSSPMFKLVMTSSPNTTAAPHSIPLPINETDDVHVQTFQVPPATLQRLSLEFSLYPNFGTKTIGRAVALPGLFVGRENSGVCTLPILDHRLHLIGEVGDFCAFLLFWSFASTRISFLWRY